MVEREADSRRKVSITFDPFMYLTLPLPVNKKWFGSIFYMPWDTTKPILKVILLNHLLFIWLTWFKDTRRASARCFVQRFKKTSRPLDGSSSRQCKSHLFSTFIQFAH